MIVVMKGERFNMENMVKLEKDINKTKLTLIKKVKLKGIYENFGQKEVSKLTYKHIDISSYTDEMNTKRDIISKFNKWCRVYNG